MLRTLSQAMLFLVAAAVFGSAASAQDDGYRINGGDLLHISVYGEQNLDKDVPVQPDGGVAFPLVGNLNARGMTLKELQGKIAANLRESQYSPISLTMRSRSGW